MSQPRFSLTAAFVAFAGIALLFDSLASIQQFVNVDDLSRGTLSLTSLFFLLICVAMERTPSHVLLFTTVFYCWGMVALWFVNSVDAAVWLRFTLLVVGVTIASVAWLKPEAELVRSEFPG